MPLKLKVIARTDKGLVRPGNEDYLHIDDENLVYAVCDGMGGHQAGEVASMTASEVIKTAFLEFSAELMQDPLLTLNRTVPGTGDLLLKAIRLANRAIYRKAQMDPSLTGMGTTIISVACEADIMSIAHVGDSRAYRLRQDKIEPLTVDHSWVAEMQAQQNLSREEANALVGKNIILRALGVRENIEIDYRIIRLQPGDQFLLCSDGLCGYADDDEIFEIARPRRDNLEKMAEDLIQMANDRGGPDNVSVIIIEVLEVNKSVLPELEVMTFPSESPEALEAEDHWIDKILARQPTVTAEIQSGTGSPRPLLLAGIFCLFAAVAALIVYLVAFK
ncbi:MAG: Stp1/IreP family PP2C-type Ser/Thr phosphatase [Candidatus Zixiibacteriota bacterium]